MNLSEQHDSAEKPGFGEQIDNAGYLDQSAEVKKSLFPFFLNRNRYYTVVAIFTLMGVVGGYAYYALVGCKTGSCAITSSPTLSIIWGGVMGYLIPDFFFKRQ